jgi:quinol monooxygenase YgiN
MIISILRLLPLREHRREALSIFRSVQGKLKTEPGCLGCQLFEEDGYDEAVLFMGRWESEDDLNRHMVSELYGKINAAAKLSRGSPELTFHYVLKTSSMELLEGARSQAPVRRYIHNACME